MDPEPIELGDCRLVLATEAHAPGLFGLLNDEAVAPWLGGTRSLEAVVAAILAEREHFEVHGFAPWVVLDDATDQVVGRGGLRWIELLGNREVELFYAVAPSRWGRGLATSLSHVALHVGFESVGLESIVAFTTEPNLASQRVQAKLGMVHEGSFERAGLPHVLTRITRDQYRATSA
ncbi:MAG: GNAT family N-acetyltransferase [Planctomycetes bacterium]|nr:GNAT family N-acetyltransferase [Planctomycetota bacterium]